MEASFVRSWASHAYTGGILFILPNAADEGNRSKRSLHAVKLGIDSRILSCSNAVQELTRGVRAQLNGLIRCWPEPHIVKFAS